MGTILNYRLSFWVFLNLNIGLSIVKNVWLNASVAVILFSGDFYNILESKSIPSLAIVSYFFDL